jgi:hypothetical protein
VPIDSDHLDDAESRKGSAAPQTPPSHSTAEKKPETETPPVKDRMDTGKDETGKYFQYSAKVSSFRSF